MRIGVAIHDLFSIDHGVIADLSSIHILRNKLLNDLENDSQKPSLFKFLDLFDAKIIYSFVKNPNDQENAIETMYGRENELNYLFIRRNKKVYEPLLIEIYNELDVSFFGRCFKQFLQRQ